jgi:Leucine-rich repeat (LRR) protein
MNRRVLLLIIGLLFLPLGCGGPTGLEPSEFCGDHSDAAIATFEDANLTAAIRVALVVGPQERLTCGRVSGLTQLDARWSEITSLVGIQNLTSLTLLRLGSNFSISDIGALSGLTSLTILDLTNNPNLTNIQPLLDNTGLGAGDQVFLLSTNVSCTDVVALQDKDVSVFSDCP